MDTLWGEFNTLFLDISKFTRSCLQGIAVKMFMYLVILKHMPGIKTEHAKKSATHWRSYSWFIHLK